MLETGIPEPGIPLFPRGKPGQGRFKESAFPGWWCLLARSKFDMRESVEDERAAPEKGRGRNY